MSGKLIAFEGVDGSGKTTHSEMIREYLTSKGREVVLQREPGGTALGEEIRKLLLAHRSENMSLQAEMLLYLAARVQLLEQIVRPALAAGKTVLLDRYFYSTAAYQGEAGGLGAGLVLEICARLKFEVPDHIFLLDIDPQESFHRAGRGNDRIESRSPDYFRKVREGFLHLAKLDPDRFTVLDATKPVKETQLEIQEQTDQVLV